MAVHQDASFAMSFLILGLGQPPVALWVLFSVDVHVKIVALKVLAGPDRRADVGSYRTSRVIRPGDIGDLVIEERDANWFVRGALKLACRFIRRRVQSVKDQYT